ncbi:MAG: hypothetical protein QOJ57_3017 [Thermoleophilaceae bacterium]|nr:hypothetical protein [Thermoleophilaceae bacterium]
MDAVAAERVAVQAAVLAALRAASGEADVWPGTPLAELDLNNGWNGLAAALSRRLWTDIAEDDVAEASTAAQLIGLLLVRLRPSESASHP